MRTPKPAKLEAMLNGPEEFVRRSKLRGIRATDVPALPQCGERVHRGRRTQLGIDSTVDQLQQLHRELDIAKAAASQLQFRSACAEGTWPSTRRRIFCTSGTKFSRSAAAHTFGATISAY